MALDIDAWFECRAELPDGVTEASGLPTNGGVYLVTDEQDRPVLLGACENLRRVVVHRLAAPVPGEKTRRTNLSAVARRLRWNNSFSRFETTWRHWQAARRLYPETYRRLIGFGPAWFLRASLEAEFPRFQTTKECRTVGAVHLGPFHTRRQAGEWIHLLEDVFDLCRYHDILEQAPNGQACAYYDMGKCPAPCDGTVSMDAYREMIRKAIAFTSGSTAPRLSALNEEMHRASAALEYERAASIRKTIARAEDMTRRPEYDHCTDIDQAAWLLVQRAGPPRRTTRTTIVRPFFVRSGCIAPSDPVTLDELGAVAERWVSECKTPVDHEVIDTVERSEGLWLMSKFLGMGDKAPGITVPANRLPDPARLATIVMERFLPN